ncbi:ParB/RepB/Spo0J family partition protein [Humisphaera borealis]|uniref:ParB/RepB/Spo0J family partition protein n=1 Tax=Humisphaera borealis TaxID=2807512 RepID=A0A7M2X2Z1_9BACT|nr:ParB/RepB/Spo0J family partition protein [Humisphaera borealis]QOV92083.1 ParB/RepB/Spo0J family partition protein [Humisphaera borealis]
MSRETIQAIEVSRIISRPQVRREFDDGDLAKFAQSIREVGVQQPIRVRRDGQQYVIVIGERRWRAGKLAGLSSIPAIIDENDLTDTAILQLQLIENLQRADLSPREKAAAIQQLLSETKVTAAEVASKLGLSAATVTKLLSLNKLPESILASVDAGTISLSAAYELSQVADTARQAELAAQVVKGGLTRDALSGKRKATRFPAIESPSPAPSRVTVQLDDERRMVLSGPGLITLEDFIRWLDDARAKARKSLIQSFTLGTFLKMLRDQAAS